MDEATVAYLNALNRAFYAATAAAFSETREEAWAGWDALLAYLPPQRPLRVLDVGCGNARFARFLAARGIDYRYHGLDNSDALLAEARARLTGDAHTFTHWDVVARPLQMEAAFDLVVAFGVLHHLPSMARRLDFVRRLGEACATGGVVAFTTWRFYEFAALRARVVAWETLAPSQPLTLEVGDYLLDWRRGAHALRYCHYADDAEQDALCVASGLRERARYRADGTEGRANCYSVLEKT